VVTVLGFALHGAIFLSLKTTGDLQTQARDLAFKLWIPAVVGLLALAGYSYIETDLLTKIGVNPGIVPLLAPVALLLTGFFLRRKREGWAFATTSLAIAATVVTCFLIMFPRVMISSLDPAWSLTIDNAASSPYTLTVMTIVAAIFVPIVLIYQGWTYWVFRKRLETKLEGLTY
jgi:cytochrome d ubiquinol oxidase subunit II